ncbi:MAG: hypothetical protein K0S46_337 [Moraxellaceae bacterium]|jgi:hypothetical protein|nr:hypothetical protein [Moraxellaceae bacterium]
MTPEQIAYIEQRRRQIRYWPWMAGVLVALLMAAYAWLWWAAPINISPAMVLEQFHTRTVSDEEMIMLAARGTLALIGCGMFVFVLVLLISLALWNELRLIRMIDALAPARTDAAPPAGAGVVDAPEEPAAGSDA